MVKKAVNAEAKSAFQPCSSTREIDQNYSHGNQPVNSTVTKSQSSAIKDFWMEKPKTRSSDLLLGP